MCKCTICSKLYKFTKYIKKYIEEHWRGLILILILTGIIVLYFLYFKENFSNYLKVEKTDTKDISTNLQSIHAESLSAFHNVIILLLTMLLVLVAAIQLEKINKTGRADFISRLSQHYGSEPIIKARQIIHELYLRSKRPNNNKCECEYNKIVANKIVKMRNDIKNYKEYIYLRNVLDFLEDLAYQEKINNINSKDISELMGPALEFYYQVFYKLIKDSRVEFENETDYCELENLVKKCKKHMNFKKCCKCDCKDCKIDCGCFYLKEKT